MHLENSKTVFWNKSSFFYQSSEKLSLILLATSDNLWYGFKCLTLTLRSDVSTCILRCSIGSSTFFLISQVHTIEGSGRGILFKYKPCFNIMRITICWHVDTSDRIVNEIFYRMLNHWLSFCILSQGYITEIPCYNCHWRKKGNANLFSWSEHSEVGSPVSLLS